ncbi:hypothetical protein [Chitinophaga tropicalis]|uniref:Uncharacterized protein n=1 Tax=Chitinophaga tropicalis TaxID=2683588 RepID=A0A7K1U9E9_9BACT|nr:hypothetical protein [Chitinophaga tropicalis]MVT10997.1 hypothetical protein [Chitinophaga tropicalis]
MKPVSLILLLLFAVTTIAAAQQKTRDILFPDFQKDIAALKQKETKQEANPPKTQGRSVKESIFTNYRPQTSANSRLRTQTSRSTGKAQPSDISSEVAQQAIKASEAANPRPVTPPVITQGEQPKEKVQPRQMQIKKN